MAGSHNSQRRFANWRGSGAARSAVRRAMRSSSVTLKWLAGRGTTKASPWLSGKWLISLWRGAGSWGQDRRMFWADGWPSPALLTFFARLALVHGEPSTALRLAGAADAVDDTAQHGVLPTGVRRAVPWGPLPPLAEYLGDDLDLAAGGAARHHPDWEAGRAMPPSEAVNLALEIAAKRIASKGDGMIAQRVTQSPNSTNGPELPFRPQLET